MRKALIDRFLRELDRGFAKPAEIILTGAAAGALLGVLRPSLDIDFEIRVRSTRKTTGQFLIRDAIIQRAAEQAGIAVNYSEDIGHWSMVNFLNYRRTALPYQKIGRLDVKIMAPEYWTIGKMGRFYGVDIQDVLRMIRQRKLKHEILISLWGKALRSSPLSLALRNFKRNVTYFIERYGKTVWGRKFDPVKGIALFERAARIE